MKKFILVFLLGLAASLLISGCSAQGGKSSSSQMPSSTPAVSPVQTASSQAEQAASAPSPVGNGQQEGPVGTVKTDSQKFNDKFKNNPIDKKYISDSAKAISNIDMVKLSDRYAGIWQKEITHAYSELTESMKTDSSMKPAKLKAEQEKWESGKTAALKKIASDAQAAGGSMAQVDSSSETMEFYRSRAAQLYRELYDYNKNYTYAAG